MPSQRAQVPAPQPGPAANVFPHPCPKSVPRHSCLVLPDGQGRQKRKANVPSFQAGLLARFLWLMKVSPPPCSFSSPEHLLLPAATSATSGFWGIEEDRRAGQAIPGAPCKLGLHLLCSTLFGRDRSHH